jgi:hypothetical protein
MRVRRSAAALALVLLTRSRGGLAAAATVSESGAPPPARASEPRRPEARPQVVLDVTPVDSAIVPLLRAELSALGVDVVDGPAAADAVTIHVALTATGEALDVSIVDPRTGRTTVQETFSVQSGTSMDPRTAVLHAVELLRWHLRFTPTSETVRAPAGPPVEAQPTRPIGPPQTSNIRIGLTPLASYSPGGTGLGLGGQVDVLRRWGRFGARGLGGSVLVPNRLSVPEGSLEVTASWGGLAGVLILGGDRPTTLEVGAGGALFVSALHGTANAGNVGQDDRLLTVSLFGDLRLRRRITQGFALSASSSLFVPWQSSRLRVLDREVGRYGQIVVAFGIGAELALF